MKDTSRQTNMEPIGQNTYFRNLVRKYEQRNISLAEREAELRQRVDLLQSTLPAILVWNLWRTRQDEPMSLVDVARAISNPFPQQGPGTAPSSLPNYRTQSATERRAKETGERKRPETSPCDNNGTVDPSRNVQFDVRGAPENQPSSSYQETGGGEGADKRIRELEEERQRLIAEKEEAEARWRQTETELRAKLQELENNRETQALEIAKAAEEEYRERIRELEEELRVIKEQSQEPTITMVYGAIQYPLTADIDIAREDMFLGERPSSDSLKSCDVECMKQLQQLVENELNIKRRIADLEQKEACIYSALQSTDMIMGNPPQSIERGPATERGGETQLTFGIPSDQDLAPTEIVPTTELVTTTEFSMTRKIEPLTATSSRASGPPPAGSVRSREVAPPSDTMKVCPPCEGKCEPCSDVDQIEVEIPQPVAQREFSAVAFDPSNPNEAALHSRIEELEQVISELRKVIADMENEKICMLNKYDELTQALAESDKNMQKLQEEVDELQKNLAQRGDNMNALQQGYEQETTFLKTRLSAAENDFNFASCECDAMKQEKSALERQIQDLIGEKEELGKTIEDLNKSLAAKDEELRLAIEAAQQGVPFVRPETAAPAEVSPETAAPAEVSPETAAPPAEAPEAPAPPAAAGEPCTVGPKKVVSHLSQVHITTCDTDFDEEGTAAPTVAVSKPPEVAPAPSAPPAEEVSPAPVEPPPPEVPPAPIEPPPPEVPSAPIEPPPPEVPSAPSAPPPPEVSAAPSAPQPPDVPDLSQVHTTTCDTDFDEEATAAPPEVAPAPSAPPPAAVSFQPPDAPSVYISEQPLDSGSTFSTATKPPEAPSTAQPFTTDSEAPTMLAGVVLAAVRKQDAENVGREVDAIVAHTKECQVCSAAVDEAINTLFSQILGLLELIAQGHMDEPIEGVEFPRVLPKQEIKEPPAEEPVPPPAEEPEAAPAEEPEPAPAEEPEEAPAEEEAAPAEEEAAPAGEEAAPAEEEAPLAEEPEEAPAEESEVAPAEEEAVPAEEAEETPAGEEAAPEEGPEESTVVELQEAAAEEEEEEAAPAEETVEAPAEEEAAPAEEEEAPAEEAAAPAEEEAAPAVEEEAPAVEEEAPAEEEAAPAEEEAAPAEEEEAPAEEEAAPAEEEAAPAEEEEAPAEEEAAPAEEEAAPAEEEAAPAAEPEEAPAEEETAPVEEEPPPAEGPEAPSAEEPKEPEPIAAPVTFGVPDKPPDTGVPGECDPLCWRDVSTKPSYESRSITSDPSCSILCWAETPIDEDWYVRYLSPSALLGSKIWKNLDAAELQGFSIVKSTGIPPQVIKEQEQPTADIPAEDTAEQEVTGVGQEEEEEIETEGVVSEEEPVVGGEQEITDEETGEEPVVGGEQEITDEETGQESGEPVESGEEEPEQFDVEEAEEQPAEQEGEEEVEEPVEPVVVLEGEEPAEPVAELEEEPVETGEGEEQAEAPEGEADKLFNALLELSVETAEAEEAKKKAEELAGTTEEEAKELEEPVETAEEEPSATGVEEEAKEESEEPVETAEEEPSAAGEEEEAKEAAEIVAEIVAAAEEEEEIKEEFHEAPAMQEEEKAEETPETVEEKTPTPVSSVAPPGYRIEKITSSTSPMLDEFAIIRCKNPQESKGEQEIHSEEMGGSEGGSEAQNVNRYSQAFSVIPETPDVENNPELLENNISETESEEFLDVLSEPVIYEE